MKRWFSTGKLSAPNVQTMAEAECGEGVKNTFGVPGLRLEHFTVDLMLEVFHEIKGPREPREALGDLLLMIRHASKQLRQARPPINKLTMSMIQCRGAKSPPKLKIKAAESHNLLPCMRYILETYIRDHRTVEAIDNFLQAHESIPSHEYNAPPNNNVANFCCYTRT